MITDETLEELLARTAEAFDPPAGGPAAVRREATAAAPEAPATGRRTRERRRVLVGAGGIAAVGALVAWLALAGGPGPTAAGDLHARPSTLSPAAALRGNHPGPRVDLLPSAAHAGRRGRRDVRHIEDEADLAGGVAVDRRHGHGRHPSQARSPRARRRPARLARLRARRLRLGFISLRGRGQRGRHDRARRPGLGVRLRHRAGRGDRAGAFHLALRERRDGSGRRPRRPAQGARGTRGRSWRPSSLRPRSVSDLLAVENQVENVQTSIEQIEGQQRTLASEVAYSRLTVVLQVPGRRSRRPRSRRRPTASPAPGTAPPRASSTGSGGSSPPRVRCCSGCWRRSRRC